jgi:hypothetical protein
MEGRARHCGGADEEAMAKGEALRNRDALMSLIKSYDDTHSTIPEKTSNVGHA